MKRIIKYLNPKDILLLHSLVVDATNDYHGISDFHEFELAAMSPYSTFVGQEMYPSIIEKASALLQALLTRPVFVNKEKKAAVNEKTAIIACITFLELNGYQFNASQTEITQFILKSKREKLTVDEAIEWLQSNSFATVRH